MTRRTTVILDDDLYKKIVEKSLEKYGNARGISKVINELLRKTLSGEDELLNLIYSEKIVKITNKQFEEFRRELSKRFES
ncbi:MAG: hypothetical protein ACP5GU_07465 [Thermoprotei archaeon]|jgi:hypothetical protein